MKIFPGTPNQCSEQRWVLWERYQPSSEHLIHINTFAGSLNSALQEHLALRRKKQDLICSLDQALENMANISSMSELKKKRAAAESSGDSQSFYTGGGANGGR